MLSSRACVYYRVSWFFIMPALKYPPLAWSRTGKVRCRVFVLPEFVEANECIQLTLKRLRNSLGISLSWLSDIARQR